MFYDETISYTESKDKWEEGFTLHIRRVTNNDAPVSIKVTLVNPGNLRGNQVTYQLYRPDGGLVEGWAAFNNGTSVHNVPLNYLSRVNTFIIFFEQLDRRLGYDGKLGYVTLPPITITE